MPSQNIQPSFVRHLLESEGLLALREVQIHIRVKEIYKARLNSHPSSSLHSNFFSHRAPKFFICFQKIFNMHFKVNTFGLAALCLSSTIAAPLPDSASNAAAAAGASLEVIDAIKTHNLADPAYGYKPWLDKRDSASNAATAAGASPDVVDAIKTHNLADPAYGYRPVSFTRSFFGQTKTNW